MVKVRPFEPEDIGAMRSIWNEVVAAANAFPQIEPLTTDEDALRFFQSQTLAAVATEDGSSNADSRSSDHILGLYILHPNNVGRCAHIANASYAVASNVRGRGVGRALVQDCLDQLAPHGFTGLQFNAVVTSNRAARALYDKLGFTQVGIIPQGFRNGDGVLEDIVIYYHAAPSES